MTCNLPSRGTSHNDNTVLPQTISSIGVKNREINFIIRLKNSLQIKYLPKFMLRLVVTFMIKYKCQKSVGLYMVWEYLIARSSCSWAIIMLVYLDPEVLRESGQVSGFQAVVELPKERVKFSVEMEDQSLPLNCDALLINLSSWGWYPVPGR